MTSAVRERAEAATSATWCACSRRRRAVASSFSSHLSRPVFSSAFLACTAPLRRARSSPSMDRDVAASRNGAFLLLSFWHGGARHTDFWCVGRWRSSEIVAESGEKKRQRASAIVAGRVSLTACRTHSNPVWREIRRAALGSCVDASSTSSTTTVASSGQQSTVETVKRLKTTKLLGPVAATFGAALARLPQVACIPLPPALAVTRADDSVAPTPKPKRKLSSASARLEKWCVRPVPVPRACAFRPPLTDPRLAAIHTGLRPLVRD